jgi:hypothetical protein
VIYYLNLIVAASAILAAGYVLARIQMRMRMLTSGALLAFGLLHLHNHSTATEVIYLVTHLAIVISIVHFATVANNLVVLTKKVTDHSSDRYKRREKEPDVKTDFPPHDYTKRDTENVTPK